MTGFIARLLRLDNFEPDRIVTSNIVRPRTLAILRGILCLYNLIVAISLWATTKSASGYLMFFTNLTYLGLTFYLVCSSIWSIGYLRQPSHERAQWLKNRSSWWGWVHWLLYSTVVTFHFIVPVVYWTLLNAGKTFDTLGTWQNVSVHGLDGFCAVFELVFNRHTLEPIHSFVVAGVMLLYMLLTFVVHKTKGIWVYPFLDWNQGAICVAYYLGIAIGLFVVFFVLLVLHRYRNRKLVDRCARVNHDQPLESLQHRDHPDEEKAGTQ
ncbi:hypothetical protein B0O80DRAFT_46439 [Mortierella sp. GBAus27b]|nr:hypothetical protein BGX31_008901 [Mortierella sp. GBA43]KAI8354772.1 hypothetical protein B0O80DRAFT_46439 [Mortierella sp. GBAus27b]